MKPVFGIDITTDKNNDTINGKEFITNTISKQKIEELESKQDNLTQTIEDSKLPLWVRIVKYICGAYAAIVFAGTLEALPEVGIEQAFKNAPFLTISCIVCGLIWAFLQFFAKKKEKRIFKEQDAEQQVEEIDIDIQDMYDELNVPRSAVSVDVLAFTYKIKNGEISARSVGFQSTPYLNLDLKIYVDGDALCLADMESVYTFKRSELKSIKTVNKRISVISWHKEEAPTKGKFKQFKLTVNNMGNIFFKPYHILEVEHNGETFGIYFPCYELETFESLTKLIAER